MCRPLVLLPLLILLGCCPDAQGNAILGKQSSTMKEVASEISEHREKRGAADFRKIRWEMPIPYTFTSDYSDAEKDTVRAALQTLTDNTCVDYIEDSSGPGNKLEYTITTTRECAADVGQNTKGNTQVYLRRECVHTNGILHETMHTLGFRHTQARDDRDTYVKVFSTKKNYIKVEPDTTNYGIAYEYGSIMNYQADDDMQPIDPDYVLTMNSPTGMTFNDWKLINMHYHCSEKCPEKIECLNGGYLHPRKCSECVCPKFFDGIHCEQERDVVTLQPGEVKPMPLEFPHNETVFMDEAFHGILNKSPAYLIKAPKGTKINVTIVNIIDALSKRYSPTLCTLGAVELVDGDLTRVGKLFCLEANIGHWFVSETNVIGYHLYTRKGHGFSANVTFAVVGSDSTATTSNSDGSASPEDSASNESLPETNVASEIPEQPTETDGAQETVSSDPPVANDPEVTATLEPTD